MGHYFSQLLEPLKGSSKTKLLKANQALQREPGIGAWLSAPEPDEDIALDQQSYLVIDIETSGFNPRKDAILSVGFVPIEKGRINLAKAEHYYINDALNINPDSAVVNHITPQMLSQGEPLKQVLNYLFQSLIDHVPIAHGCWIEQQFLAAQLESIWNLKKLPLQWLDTLQIEKARIANGCVPHHQDVRLTNLRQRYHLPEYQAHNALYDAIATAELFQVMTRAIYASKQPPSLKEFFHYQQKARPSL